MTTVSGPVVGRVEVWHAEDGWGVLRAPDGRSVWCHFSHLVMDGYKTLTEGAQVRFEHEVPGQDGCDARAVRVWPVTPTARRTSPG